MLFIQTEIIIPSQGGRGKGAAGPRTNGTSVRCFLLLIKFLGHRKVVKRKFHNVGVNNIFLVETCREKQ